MNKYISPSIRVRTLQSEQLLTTISFRPGDGEVGGSDPIYAPHKSEEPVLQPLHSVWGDDEEE